MREKIPCEVIRDLLPLHLDGLTSEKTGEVIEEHLKDCRDCREYFRRMERELDGTTKIREVENEKEIDYLKKVRRSGWKRLLLGAVSALLLVCAVLFVNLFFLGFPSSSYAVTRLEPDAAGKRLRIEGSFYDSASVYSRYKIVDNPDGTSRLVIYACLPSAWNRNGNFYIETELSGVVLDVNGTTVKPDGTLISRKANTLYKAQNPYVGDAPANGKVAEILGISRQLGPFKNELQTTEEPYAWILHFETRPQDPARFEEEIRRYACVLMASIDNLGEVKWDYPSGTAKTPAPETKTTKDGSREGSSMTEEACSEYVGTNIKSFSESPEKLQELLKKLDLEE